MVVGANLCKAIHAWKNMKLVLDLVTEETSESLEENSTSLHTGQTI